jgi:hypothetical protein
LLAGWRDVKANPNNRVQAATSCERLTSKYSQPFLLAPALAPGLGLPRRYSVALRVVWWLFEHDYGLAGDDWDSVSRSALDIRLMEAS